MFDSTKLLYNVARIFILVLGILSRHYISSCAGEIECEQPNNSLYTFTGNLLIQNQTLPLSPNQLLLRVR